MEGRSTFHGIYNKRKMTFMAVSHEQQFAWDGMHFEKKYEALGAVVAA